MRDPRVSAKGDLVVGIGNNEVDIVPIGLSGRVLTADPTVVTGASWQPGAGGGGVRAVGSSGLQNVTFQGDTLSAWQLGPAAYRVSVPASVGDVLSFEPSLLTSVGGDAELDVASVVGGVPARYLSSGTAVQAANGHGGLYIGVLFGRALKPIRWIVTADDIEAGEVMLSLMRRNGAGVTFGSASYPGQVDVTNFGGVSA